MGVGVGDTLCKVDSIGRLCPQKGYLIHIKGYRKGYIKGYRNFVI